jgi:hypothetical protein
MNRTCDSSSGLSMRKSGVVYGRSPADIRHLSDPRSCAVIVTPPANEEWLGALGEAVVSGALNIPRTVLPAVTPVEFAEWSRSAVAVLPASMAAPIVDDWVAIAERVRNEAAGGRVMVRVFTEAPSRRCGFHVDTVPACCSTIGALRVYNGLTTEYVDPADVQSMEAFYRYLSRRERLARMVRQRADLLAGHACAELAVLDEAPGFLRAGAGIHRVPDGATVYFKHIDIRRHWSPHPVTEAWIHRSPMRGVRRLVLNVSPADRHRPIRGQR